ncbi:MAG: type II toxin-antitoxin system RelE/ParE family toxin [Synergistaceae bacterium]|nr:type II toxin-antitoxin system RelE/ParE family toxin [Synergistaceae bacterium]
MNYKVIIAPSALEDLRDILRYVAQELASPETAVKTLDAIECAIFSLSDMPKIHALVSDDRLFALGYRKLNIKNYIVFFIVNDAYKTVEVDRVLYARRDW